MNTHYLIRTSSLKIFGPMPPAAIIKHLKNKEFSGQAELCGDLGPWIDLSEQKKMQRHYPHIYSLLEMENLHYDHKKGIISKIRYLFTGS